MKVLKIVCIGDSLTRGYKIKSTEVWTRIVQEKYGFQVLNKGVIGDTSEGMLERFQKDVIEKKPTHVIIMGGINDLIKKTSVDIIYSNIVAMIQKSEANKITPIIGIQVISEPTMAEQYWPGVDDFTRINKGLMDLRKLIIEFGKNSHIQIVDFYDEVSKHFAMDNKYDLYIDGVHLTAKGNEIMAKIVRI